MAATGKPVLGADSSLATRRHRCAFRVSIRRPRAFAAFSEWVASFESRGRKMSTTHDRNGAASLDLSGEAAWVVHDVALETLVGEDADRPMWALEVVEQVETDEPSVTPLEARGLRERLREYLADDPPSRDVDPARRVLAALDAKFEELPACDSGQ